MSLNRVLTDEDREEYAIVIDEMFSLCPETMIRKFPRANVQQAFALDTIRKLVSKDAKLLCVGSFEDTASESLIKLGYFVEEIDPTINYDLNTFRLRTTDKFDIIFSVSVIEHVCADEVFIDDICFLLKSGGYGIITCDFDNDYKSGNRLPATDVRLYTKYDLSERLYKVIKRNSCELVDKPNWDAESDFLYDGCWYSFATFVFRREGNGCY